jgi:hypothetical protein
MKQIIIGNKTFKTQTECEKNLDGNWAGNGECIIKTGGSYSAVCKFLNNIVSPSTPPSVCPRGYTGKNCNECIKPLQSVCNDADGNYTGGMCRDLQTGSDVYQLLPDGRCPAGSERCRDDFLCLP